MLNLKSAVEKGPIAGMDGHRVGVVSVTFWRRQRYPEMGLKRHFARRCSRTLHALCAQ